MVATGVKYLFVGFTGALTAIVAIAFADSDLARGLIENLSNVVLAVAGMWAAIIAHRGLATWRQQLHGTAKFEIARKFQKALIQFVHQLDAARSPASFGAEMAVAAEESKLQQLSWDDYMNPGESETLRLARSAVYARRFTRVVDAYNLLYSESLDAEVLLGPRIRDAMGDLEDLVSRLRQAIERDASESERGSCWPISATSNSDLAKYDGTDDFSKRHLSTIRCLQALVQPHLRDSLGLAELP